MNTSTWRWMGTAWPGRLAGGLRALLRRGPAAQDRADRQQRDEAARLQAMAAAMQATQAGVMVTDLQPVIVAVNPAFSEITGYREDEVLGHAPDMLRSGRQDASFHAELWHTLAQTGRWQGELWNRRKNGQLYAQWMNLSAVHDAQGRRTHYVAVFTDATARTLADERAQHLARLDPLTQLPNRAMVLERLGQAIAAAGRLDLMVGVLVIDLDHFGAVNDQLGHAAGDELLAAVARRLSQRTRREDTLGRLGGDEFVLVLEHLSQARDAGPVAQELLRLLAQPFQVQGHEVRVCASIGISLHPDDGATVGDLLRDADAAMYQAKRAGRGTWRYHSESLRAAAQQRQLLETRLRRALERGEFELSYQPLLRLSDRTLVGLEALVRLQQPDLPPVSAAEFIPVLEDNGLIVALGEWVTREACRQGRAWLDEGLDFGRIAINLSAPELRRDGAHARLCAALAASGLPPQRLEVDVTEAGLMAHGPQAEDFLRSVQAQGVQLAVDDFGTGEASLACLKRLPLGRLKIDRSFVRDLPGDASDVVQTLVTLGRSMGLSVLAEGVETEEQLDCLAQLGCECAQGLLFCPPCPAPQVRPWLRPLAGQPAGQPAGQLA